MNRRIALQSLLSAAGLVAILLAVGLLQQPTLAAPPMQEPELAIVKTAEGDGTIALGQTVRFHITVSSTGASTATNVLVHDDYDQVALPTIEILSDTRGEVSLAQSDGNIITWSLGDLAPGEQWRASYDATAAGFFEASTAEIRNSASAEADNVWGDAQATVVLTVRAPQLTLSRFQERVDEEGQIVPGATVRYTIRYANSGVADATNVILEEQYNEALVRQVGNITGGEYGEDGKLRWTVGTLIAGGSGEVSYEATLMPAIPLGAADSPVWMYSESVIRADGVEAVSASDSIRLDIPMLGIERDRVDLNGSPITFGDTLRFVIRIRNSGSAAASGVVVRDDFDELVVAEISNISAGGREVEGIVEWSLGESLAPGVERTLYYEARLVSQIGELTTMVNTALVSVSGTEIGRVQTGAKVEPVQGQTLTSLALGLLLGLLGAIVVGSALWAIYRRRKAKAAEFRRLPTAPLKPTDLFADVQRRVGALRQQVADGLLTEEECKARMRDLMVEDADGNWWMVGYETGRWYRHDGSAWVRDDPPPGGTSE